MVNASLDDPDCSFKYAGFCLAGVYMILLIAVVRFFVKLVISKDHKRQAQKVFLGLVTFQCTIRMFFFLLWPILGPTCYPVLSARTFDWLIIPGDFPAALFLTAFGVLVITFARIYHIVLHGDVRSMRRFHYLIAAIIIVNTGVYLTQVADWINSATGDQYPIFADVYPYVLAGAAFCTALQFLVYGTLLFFHVRKVLRHTGNNGTAAPAVSSPRLTVAASSPLQTSQHHQLPQAVPIGSGSATPQRVSIAVGGRQVGTPSNGSSSNAPHRVLISSVAQALQPSSPTHQPLTVGTIQVGGHQSNHSSPSNSPPGSPSRSVGSRHGTPGRQPTRYSEHHHIVHHHPPPPELQDDEGGSPRDLSATSPPIVVHHTNNGRHAHNNSHASIVRPHNPSPMASSSAIVSDDGHNVPAAAATVTNGSRNPMRKVAQIAAICTMCLLARTALLPIMAKWFSDQNPWITVIYFSTAELLPLVLMLRVFEAATDQTPMAGGAAHRQGHNKMAAHTTDVHIIDQQSAADMALDDNHNGGNGSHMDGHDDMAVDHHPYSPPLHHQHQVLQQQQYHHRHHNHNDDDELAGVGGGDDDDPIYDDRSAAMRQHDDTRPLHQPLLHADT